MAEITEVSERLGLTGVLTSAATSHNTSLPFTLATQAAIDRTKVRQPFLNIMYLFVMDIYVQI